MREGLTSAFRSNSRARIRFALYLYCLLFFLRAPELLAVTFTNQCRIVVDDPSGALSLPANNVLTVSFWFKLSIPTGYELPGHMTLLMNRQDGNEGANYAYFFRFNRETANVEFLSRGDGGRSYQRTLIERPYLDRWYHIAVSRHGPQFFAYVDGRPIVPAVESSDIGNVGPTDGVSIGGSGGSSDKHLLGEVIEVAIYQSGVDGAVIRDRMFKDQRANTNLRGYFKLAAGTEPYSNSVTTPPPGTLTARSVGPNVPLFEETDRGGEQSLFDSKRNKGSDAIASLSGAVGWSQTALARATPGIAFDFRYGYSSALPKLPGPDATSDPYSPRSLGGGWRHTFDVRVIPEQSVSERRLLTWEGSIETWDRIPDTDRFQTRHKEYRGELLQLDGGDYEWTTPERLIYRFRDPTLDSLMAGRLMWIRDFNGNTNRVLWNEAEGYVQQVIDTAGGIYRFNFDTTIGRLTNVSFNTWQVNFVYDSTNRLLAKWVTNTVPAAMGITVPNINTRWEFRYGANELLSQIIDPKANLSLTVSYDKYWRQTNQVDALLRTNRTDYGVPTKRQLRRTDAAGFQWLETYDRKGHILAQQDPLTNITHYTYDDRGNRTSITEPLGWQTLFGYDDRANLIASTNALGEVATWKFHPRFNKAIEAVTPQPASVNGSLTWTNRYEIDDVTGNLLRHHDDLGDLVRYTYRTNGLVETFVDANNRTNRLEYDANGFLNARIDAAGYTSRITSNDVGWKLAETDPLDQRTSFAFDMNGNVVETVDPGNRRFLRSYDPNGNLLATSDAVGRFTRNGYDAANQRTSMTNRADNVWRYQFDQRGSLTNAIDPLLNATASFYDAANRLERVLDPLGNSASTVYDANGNKVGLIDQVGQRWVKGYDRLNRLVIETDPENNTRRSTYDGAGRVHQVFTPNQFASTHEYDGRGRLVKWIDAENNPWLYAYDGVANITNITDALGGHYIMTYGPRNERTLERNQDNFEWRYGYDELLRLQSQRDPNSTTRELEYDEVSRPKKVIFSTRRVNTISYDDNNNPRVLTRRDPGKDTTTTRLTYDVLDRVIEAEDDFHQIVRYAYDALGRPTTLTYPMGKPLNQEFDALGRLTNQVFQFDATRSFVASYGYDRAGRLVNRSYPNGVVQSNAFDSAGRMTNLIYQASGDGNPVSRATIGIALTYAYDRNGNKTGSSEKGTMRWPLPTLSDEQSTFTPSGRLQTRTISDISNINAPPISWTYLYDPSCNLTNATSSTGSYGLGYDEDNRTTSIGWQNGTNNTVIGNRYDALGRRIARSVEDSGKSTETRFVLNLVGGMERILCDADSANTISYWYVHGPDLSFRVDTLGILQCYHADAQANIIALTGANGTNIIQYAYTPYGRVLGRTNHTQVQTIESQPYLFVGSHGVMEELPGLYFMRARYYSAEAGVFLSTDPVKKIGPGWKTTLQVYGPDNPMRYIDPNGESFVSFVSSAAKRIATGFGRTVQAATTAYQKVVNSVANANIKSPAGVPTSPKQGGSQIGSGQNRTIGSGISGNGSPVSGPLSKAGAKGTVNAFAQSAKVNNGPTLQSTAQTSKPFIEKSPEQRQTKSGPILFNPAHDPEGDEWQTFNDGFVHYRYRRMKHESDLTPEERIRVLIRGPMILLSMFMPGYDMLEAFVPNDPSYEVGGVRFYIDYSQSEKDIMY